MEQKKEQQKHVPNFVYIILTLLIFAVLGLLVFFILKGSDYAGSALQNGITAAKASYQESKELAKKDAHEAYAQKAKEQYKVQVHSSISILSVQETADLNVLECQTSDYFYREDKERKITACLKVTGTGKFTVNLKNAEYCVDQQRCAVFIRLPQPVFEYTGETDEEPLYFDKDSAVHIGPFEIGDGTTQEGSEILDELRAEASEKLSEELSSDADLQYSEAAKESAVKLLTELVKAANPDVPDVTVDISFME